MKQKIGRDYRTPENGVEFEMLKSLWKRHPGWGKSEVVSVADSVDLEFEAADFPDLSALEGLSDMAKMLWISRAARQLGLLPSFRKWMDGENYGICIEWEK